MNMENIGEGGEPTRETRFCFSVFKMDSFLFVGGCFIQPVERGLHVMWDSNRWRCDGPEVWVCSVSLWWKQKSVVGFPSSQMPHLLRLPSGSAAPHSVRTQYQDQDQDQNTFTRVDLEQVSSKRSGQRSDWSWVQTEWKVHCFHFTAVSFCLFPLQRVLLLSGCVYLTGLSHTLTHTHTHTHTQYPWIKRQRLTVQMVVEHLTSAPSRRRHADQVQQFVLQGNRPKSVLLLILTLPTLKTNEHWHQRKATHVQSEPRTKPSRVCVLRRSSVVDLFLMDTERQQLGHFVVFCIQRSALSSQTGLGSSEQGLLSVLRSNWRW